MVFSSSICASVFLSVLILYVFSVNGDIQDVDMNKLTPRDFSHYHVWPTEKIGNIDDDYNLPALTRPKFIIEREFVTQGSDKPIRDRKRIRFCEDMTVHVYGAHRPWISLYPGVIPTGSTHEEALKFTSRKRSLIDGGWEFKYVS